MNPPTERRGTASCLCASAPTRHPPAAHTHAHTRLHTTSLHSQKLRRSMSKAHSTKEAFHHLSQAAMTACVLLGLYDCRMQRVGGLPANRIISKLLQRLQHMGSNNLRSRHTSAYSIKPRKERFLPSARTPTMRPALFSSLPCVVRAHQKGWGNSSRGQQLAV
jgi:hypothetical protein